MAQWQDYLEVRATGVHTVVGQLKLFENVHSSQLGNERDLYVYLPPSYAQGNKRYPVLYMHDGQNLFDRAISFAGEWQVDETMEMLSREGIEAIVVGIPNAGERRMAEYSPFPDARYGGGEGDKYLAFLAETVKPLIERDFRCLDGPAYAGVMGSSMGGLISLYAFFRYPGVWGFAGAVSPALVYATGAIFDYIEKASPVPGKLYVDVGTHEGYNMVRFPWRKRRFSRLYLQQVRRMHALLLQKGYQSGRDLIYVEEKEAIHHESAWSRRLPEALRFLLKR
jgi:predicted alpha/beta superfamily hydrolase